MNNPQKYIVYAVKNDWDNKVYFGSGLPNRLAFHESRLLNLKHPCHEMQQDFIKHPDYFSFEIIKETTKDQCRQEEQLMIMQVKTFSKKWKLYNRKNAFKF